MATASYLPDDFTAAFERAIDLDSERSRFVFDLDLRANAGLMTPDDEREFAAWLRAQRDGYVVMYHGTDGARPIEAQGLLPTSARRRNSLQSAPGFVYLAYAASRARTFAEMGHPYATTLAVYAVCVPVRLLKADADQLRNKRLWGASERGLSIQDTLTHSLAFGGGARVRGALPPAAIRRVEEASRAARDWRRLASPGVSPPEEYGWRCVEGWREGQRASVAAPVRPRRLVRGR